MHGRRGRSWLGIFASALLVLVVPVGGGTASAQTPGMVFLSSGTLVDATGAPIPGVEVDAYVFSPLDDSLIGVDEQGTVVASTTTDAYGVFYLQASGSQLTLYADGAGMLNVDLMSSSVQAEPVGATAVAYSATTSSWTAPDGTPIETTGSTVYQASGSSGGTGAATASMASATTGASLTPLTIVQTCFFHRQVLDSTVRSDRVGQVHVGWDLTATVEFSAGSTASMEVATGASVGSLSASGNFHQSNTSDASGTAPTPKHATSRYDAYYTAQFRHYHIKNYYIGSNCPTTKTWITDEVGKWVGGPTMAASNSLPVKNCNFTNSIVDYMNPGATRTKTTGSTYSQDFGVGGYGFSLRVKSEQRKANSITWKAGTRYNQYDICGAAAGKTWSESGLVYGDL